MQWKRAKSEGALLREAILRDSTTLEDTQAAIARVQATNEPTTTPDSITVQAESSAEARRTVMDMFPGAVVTGVHRVR